MDLRDVKVLPQRKRNAPALGFDSGGGVNSACASAPTPSLPAPSSGLVASAAPPADDSADIKGLTADALGIYHCDTSRRQFEFLDHTADVQIHSWGDCFAQAAEQAVVAMFNYISETASVEADPSWNRRVCATGHDLQSLLYNFMTEWLFEFCGGGFMPAAVRIVDCDVERFRIASVGIGERFDREKHVLGTEVKAITYSAMQINQRACGSCDIYVIVDI